MIAAVRRFFFATGAVASSVAAAQGGCVVGVYVAKPPGGTSIATASTNGSSARANSLADRKRVSGSGSIARATTWASSAGTQGATSASGVGPLEAIEMMISL